KEIPMTCHPYSERVARCAGLMKAAKLDVLLLAKPANMAYLTGDGRLCAPAARPRLFRRRRRWRPMWSSPSGTAASTPALGGCASRIRWS
ncbi:MAG: aminopeptidase P family N-terminal domain-containing protein, partial [Deltaproteobacteria bacterium]|nr:aminopeptidase P family N-terminal domain-containing protein [Deltaproteobacteria bacterium]